MGNEATKVKTPPASLTVKLPKAVICGFAATHCNQVKKASKAANSQIVPPVINSNPTAVRIVEKTLGHDYRPQSWADCIALDQTTQLKYLRTPEFNNSVREELEPNDAISNGRKTGLPRSTADDTERRRSEELNDQQRTGTFGHR